MKKLLFSVTLLLVTHLTLFPQAVTYKWLEEKNNLNEKGFFGDAIKTMPIFIPEDAIQKAVNEYNKNSLDTTAAKTNLLIGYPMPFNISAEQSTKLTMITGETLRKLTICAKGAAGLTLIFSELSLVHGSNDYL